MTPHTDAPSPRTAGSTGTSGASRAHTASTHTTTRLALRGLRLWHRVRRGLRRAWRRTAETVTVVGWVLLAIAAVGLGAGLAFGWIEFVVAGIVAAVLLLLATAFLFGWRAYDVSLALDHERVVAGVSVDARLGVENVGRGVALPTRIDVPIGDGLVDVYVPLLRRGHRYEREVVIPTARRGVVTVGPARTVQGDPLGILGREATWDDVHTLYIHPVTTALHSTTTGFLRDLEGRSSRQVVDADISFHAIREYAAGDAQRQIHWRSTAKTGTLMVRQYEQTRRSRMLLILARNDAEYADDDEFELAVSAAASVGRRGIRDGRELDVVVGADVPAFARARLREIRGLTTLSARALLDEMSGIRSSADATGLRDVTAITAESHSETSIAFVVCGSAVALRDIQRAALAFPSDVGVVFVVCDPSAEPGMRRLGATTVLTVGLLEDLRHLLARGAAS